MDTTELPTGLQAAITRSLLDYVTKKVLEAACARPEVAAIIDSVAAEIAPLLVVAFNKVDVHAKRGE